MILDELSVPIVLAPLAGGPSTPRLAAAVSEAGGLGFLAAGYLGAADLRERLEETRTLTRRPIGVNLFVPGRPADRAAISSYLERIGPEAEQAGVRLGEPRFDDDDWQAKVDLLAAAPVPVVSFTFGCPSEDTVDRLHAAGSEVWVTVTRVEEAVRAVAVGADALVVQGAEAGGHRGGFSEDGDAIGLLSLLQLVRQSVDVPLVATGGIATGAGVAAVLVAGAAAAQLGTVFLRCPEAGTSEVHRQAIATAGPTALTRAFTGRLARGVRNRFLDRHSDQAPAAYPEIHYVTAPLRQAARAKGDPDLVNLWAGQTHALAPEIPAADLVTTLSTQAQTALQAATSRLRLGGQARPS